MEKFLSSKGRVVYQEAFFEDMRDTYLRKDPWTRLRLKHIERLVRPSPGDKIIDLGCAAGAVSHFCWSKGASVLGVDLSKQAIAMAKKTFTGKGLSFDKKCF